MPVLVLQCVAPLQAWGKPNVYRDRETEPMPTKSGVIGMIASALGRDRTDDLTDLRELQMGIRVDQQGSVLTDFQTLHSKYNSNSYVIHKDYLTDARFLVCLKHQSLDFLKKISDALLHPVYPIYFGRKCCIPMDRIVLGISEENDLLNVLYSEPSIAIEDVESMPVFVEGREYKENAIKTITMIDDPVTFDSNKRRHMPRRFYEVKPKIWIQKEEIDFFADL